MRASKLARLRWLLAQAPTDECLDDWGGFAPNTSGYFQVSVNGKRVMATHLACPGEGDVVRHRCDNPACVNPAHLERGSQLDNVADMVDRARQARGEKQATSKLTADQVREIRRRYAAGGVTHRQLAVEYGVATPGITNILNRKTWRHV